MPIVVTGRHRPHEVVFLAFSALAGLVFVAGVKPPSSLEQLVPVWIIWTWYVLLLASGVIGLVSLPLRDPYRALVLERAAMLGHVAAPALYGLALLASGNAAALFSGLFFAAWAAASGWRAWQIQRGIRALRQAGDEQ